MGRRVNLSNDIGTRCRQLLFLEADHAAENSPYPLVLDTRCPGGAISQWTYKFAETLKRHSPPDSRDCLAGQSVQLLLRGRQHLFHGRRQLALGLQSAQLIQGLAEPGFGFVILFCRPMHHPQFVETDSQFQGGLDIFRILAGQLF